MKPGTKPIDFATAKRTGRRRTERHGTEKDQPKHGEPSLVSGFPPMPRKVFGKEGRAEWRRIKTLLRNSTVITQLDRAPLVQYCLLYERMVNDPTAFSASDNNALRLICESIGLSPPGRGRQRGVGE